MAATAKKKFNGVFDGQGHRIKNLTLENVTENANSVLGFFAWVRGGSTIKNLIMDSSCSFHGYKRVSAFVGVTQVNNGGAVNILNCVNEATVTANDNPAGAFVGCRNPNNNDTPQIIIDGCVNIGTITAKSETAAFVGWANRENNDVGWTNHIVRNSYNFGTINNIDDKKRGFIRADNFLITNSYDFGSNNANNSQNVSYSWTTANPVTSGELAYHLNQVAEAQVLYQTLGTDADDAYPVPFSTHPQVYSHGEFRCDGEPLGTVTFDNTDSGDVIPSHNYSANGFCQNVGCTKPNQAPELVSEWYELTNAGNVEWFSDKVNGGETAIKGKMMNDIDFKNIENLHTPIGNTTGKKFNGTFDGQGFRIKNMIINRDSENGVGFFGYLRGAGTTTIQNLIIDASCSIHGNNRVGAITGSVQVGGGTITIENVINEANVSANGQDAGGIFGGCDGGNPAVIIKNVLNKGNVTSDHDDAYVGALCCYLEGNGDSRIENFVNLGTIGTHNGGNIGRHNIGNVTNLIDLSDTANKTQGTDSGLTTDDIASGKLAYTVGWGQLIGTDEYPTPFNETEVLYVGDAGYSTMYDASKAWDLNGDAKAFIGTLTPSGNGLHLEEIDVIPAGTAVVIGGTYYNKVSTTATADATGNILIGSTGYTVPADREIFALGIANNVVGFYPVAAGVIIPAGKAYLDLTGSPVKEFLTFVLDDDATAVEMVNGQWSMVNDQPIYNVAGQRIQKMQKGINIVNGKKIAVK